MDEQERRLIAYHEGGHALVAHVLPNTDEVHKITVIPRGRALGYTLTLPEQDKFLMTREQMRDELAMLMGGRVAEEIVAGDITTGAGNDIERATKVARQMVTEYGMSRHDRAAHARAEAGRGLPRPRLGIHARLLRRRRLRDRPGGPPADRRGPRRRARDPVTEHRAKLDELAALLIEKETLDREEVEAFFKPSTKRAAPRGRRMRSAGLAVSRTGDGPPRANPPGP